MSTSEFKTERRKSVPLGAPGWVTDELIVDTITVWQPYYKKELTARDALEIIISVSHLADALGHV